MRLPPLSPTALMGHKLDAAVTAIFYSAPFIFAASKSFYTFLVRFTKSKGLTLNIAFVVQRENSCISLTSICMVRSFVNIMKTLQNTVHNHLKIMFL